MIRPLNCVLYKWSVDQDRD